MSGVAPWVDKRKPFRGSRPADVWEASLQTWLTLLFGDCGWRVKVKERPVEQHGGPGKRDADLAFSEPGVMVAHRSFLAVIEAAQRLGKTHEELVAAAAAVSAPRSSPASQPAAARPPLQADDTFDTGDKYDRIKQRPRAPVLLASQGKVVKTKAALNGLQLPYAPKRKETPALRLDIVAFLRSIDPPLSNLESVLHRLQGRQRLSLHHFASVAAAHRASADPPECVAAYLMVANLLGITGEADVRHFTNALHQLQP